jgi:hypothetical protein
LELDGSERTARVPQEEAGGDLGDERKQEAGWAGENGLLTAKMKARSHW